MHNLFFSNTKNTRSAPAANTILQALLLMLLTLPESTLVAAQGGGGGSSGGSSSGGSSSGDGYHDYSGSNNSAEGGGNCNKDCQIAWATVGGVIFIGLIIYCICICAKGAKKTAIDNSLPKDCPYENPQYWITKAKNVVVDISIDEQSDVEYSNMIKNLKLHPEVLNNIWEGKYTEPGPGGSFSPKLSLHWNNEKNWMEFQTSEDARDDYGDYRIKKGIFSFENNRFVAHKEYFKPSKQTVPYTIVQAGDIKFAMENDQIDIKASGSWYSSYKPSVQGTFEYNTSISALTLTDKEGALPISPELEGCTIR